ncbi:hypothetical protein HOLleu_15028 [Holothuria leucospilota]|uniref:Thioredoxin domain-containing protein n=1 Tax=Holothuria leucospilota TaxID=206669 RepID=A0A9Q1C8J9_HOLLE|nr:hypothetical protein HOLleu_15028 [Holothuria leucospilota]
MNQRLYLRRYFAAVFMILDVNLSCFQSSASFFEDVNIPEISVAGIYNREAGGSRYPLCVFFTTGGKDCREAEKYFLRFLLYFDDEIHWQFRRFTVKNDSAYKHIPPQIPAIQCLSTWTEERIYTGPWKLKPVKAWAQELLKNYNSRIPSISEDEDLSQKSNGSLLLLILIESPVSQDEQRSLKQLRDDFVSVRFFMHPYHRGQRSTRSFAEKFSIETFPAAVLLNFTGGEKVLGKVENGFKLLERVEEMLIIQTTESVSAMSQDTFHSWLQGDDMSSVYLLCFHAVWADENPEYLHVFSRSSKVFHNLQTTLKFGTVDVENEREILMKDVDPKMIRKFPFSVLFWKNMTSEGPDLRQILLSSRPTPSAVSDLLETSGLEIYDRNGNIVQYIPWETEDVCQTFHDYSHHDPMCIGRVNASIIITRDHESSRERLPDFIQHTAPRESDLTSSTTLCHRDTVVENDKNMLKEGSPFSSVNQLTDDKWDQVIQQSRSHPGGAIKQKTLVTMPWEETSPQTVLVAFIQGSCRSCDNNINLFEKVAKNLDDLGTGIFYAHNCTTDPKTCERQNIKGFPTVIAFRNFGKLRYERCSSNSHIQQYLRMDYHGILTEKLLMEWFSQVSTPSVQYTTTEEFIALKKINDVSLSADLYPLSLAKKYLPNIAGPNSWYPYECFQLACERLYGKASCYGIITENLQNRDATMLEEDPEMVVTQIEMHRRDNVSALVFSLGKALITTLQNKQDTSLHRFHAPHRYAIKSGQRCEDNHSSCTDVIVSFVQDHSRLPVTHITAAAFHTHGSLGFGKNHSSSIFGSGLPVLLALATSQQLTDDAPLLKLLTKAAYQFYNQIVFAALNVDEFPQWAARFVPVHFYRHVVENNKYITDDMVPSLFIYPRLLIVTAGNHQKAIFFPKYDRFSLSSKAEGRTLIKNEVINFVSKFLSSPDNGWIETELF